MVNRLSGSSVCSTAAPESSFWVEAGVTGRSASRAYSTSPVGPSATTTVAEPKKPGSASRSSTVAARAARSGSGAAGSAASTGSTGPGVGTGTSPVTSGSGSGGGNVAGSTGSAIVSTPGTAS